MPQDTKQLSNRDYVVRQLRDLAAALVEAARTARDAAEALKALDGASKKVRGLQGLAEQRPTPGSRPLPRGIRTRLLTLAKRIARAAEEIRRVPVTRDERLVQKAAKRR